jgi:hypothetical protein
LKLYLREEHLQEQAVKKRLKRSYGTTLHEQPADPQASTSTDPSGSLPTPGNIPEAMHENVSASDDSDVASPDAASSIHSLVDMLIHAVDDDNTPPPASDTSQALSVSIENLFDFGRAYWVEAYDKLGMRGLQDELELCELLDHDAEGDTVEGEAEDALVE